ncbi:MAG: hypothetical protein IPK90_08110 [Chitinophagaceae bacterium]|nr:hypothetical protein [Chitinophagaceae bacterium]
MLEVEIKYYIRFGPLGDRLNLDVKFDGKVVGNYHALRSYFAGGAGGSWPIIKNRDWQIVFNLELVENSEDYNKFSIEYYENYFPSLTVCDNIKDIDRIRFDREIILKEYTFDEIQQYKRTYWEIPVIDSITGITWESYLIVNTLGSRNITVPFMEVLKEISGNITEKIPG